MLNHQKNRPLFALVITGVMMSTSQAKPNLTTPVDMSVLHAADSGYHFIHQSFSASAPKTYSSNKNDGQTNTLQTYAKPRHYQVWLAIPKQPAGTYPFQTSKTSSKVLYMLDGNAAIDDLNTDLLRALSESASKDAPILVFIGYQTPYRFDVDARAYDYTPPLLSAKTGDKAAFKEDGRERLNGGAEQFYAMIEQEIKPWVYQQLGTKPTQEALWGHSYGGLFVLYNLFAHPDTYQQYFSADPSLWWQEGEMTKYWQAYQALPKSRLTDLAKTKQLRLTFSQSSKQAANTLDTQANTAKMPLSKQAFAEEVCAHFKESCRYQFFEQSHGEVFKTSLLESLQRF
ncbi:alpha/beta hydrolase-fold protein [Psychrobacter sp. B38]|uniref:alpha/beta hydrolase n=1 Tax=Psychrobacter sp. B38 TaxID=3143538 RepID=UPI00320EB204